jgi:hypothetical protein
MIVRKARGKNKVGKITLLPYEIALVRKLGIPVEDYVREALLFIAKERKWKWFFKTRRTTNASSATKT